MESNVALPPVAQDLRRRGKRSSSAAEPVQRTTDLLDALQREIDALGSPLSLSLNRYSTYLTDTTVAAFLIHLSGVITDRLSRARNV